MGGLGGKGSWAGGLLGCAPGGMGIGMPLVGNAPASSLVAWQRTKTCSSSSMSVDQTFPPFEMQNSPASSKGCLFCPGEYRGRICTAASRRAVCKSFNIAEAR